MFILPIIESLFTRCRSGISSFLRCFVSLPSNTSIFEIGKCYSRFDRDVIDSIAMCGCANREALMQLYWKNNAKMKKCEMIENIVGAAIDGWLKRARQLESEEESDSEEEEPPQQTPEVLGLFGGDGAAVSAVSVVSAVEESNNGAIAAAATTSESEQPKREPDPEGWARLLAMRAMYAKRGIFVDADLTKEDFGM